jgi:hypothetical protein
LTRVIDPSRERRMEIGCCGLTRIQWLVKLLLPAKQSFT